MKYPIGTQTFSTIIEENMVYVDKTDLVYQLAQKRICFFCRPPSALVKGRTFRNPEGPPCDFYETAESQTIGKRKSEIKQYYACTGTITAQIDVSGMMAAVEVRRTGRLAGALRIENMSRFTLWSGIIG